MGRNSGFIPRFRIAPSYDLDSKSINSICRVLNAATLFLGMASVSSILFDQRECSTASLCLPHEADQYTLVDFSLLINQIMRLEKQNSTVQELGFPRGVLDVNIQQ